MSRSAWALAAFVALPAIFGGSRAAATGIETAPLSSQIERLSIDLRASRLSLAEREEIDRARASSSDDAVYEKYVDRWLVKESLERLLPAAFGSPLDWYFLGTLTPYKPSPQPSSWIY